MRNCLRMDTLQIETTLRCVNRCSNCTRGANAYPAWDMSFDQFKAAVDSLEGYPEFAAKVSGRKPIGPYIGVTGGDPLLHPQFEEFCEYLRSKFPKEQCGLWSCFPRGREHLGETIVKTFSHVLINDHSISTIYHTPFLVGIEEVIPDKDEMWDRIDNCYIEYSWSASINPKGVFLCEIMASHALLFNEDGGFPVEKGWWKRPSWEFKSQIEHYCPKCGGPASLPRRASTEKFDDISPKNLERLKAAGRKVDMDRYVISDCKEVELKSLPPMAAYKDFSYRQGIAARYGMFLTINEQGFWTPHLKKHKGERDFFEPKPIFDIYKERWAKTA